MSWLPWLLLLAVVATAAWAVSEIARCVHWARRALLRGDSTARPRGWLVQSLRLEELFVAIESRSANESEIRAAAARRIEALLSPLTDAVLVVDAQDRLRLANPAARSLFSLNDADAGGPIVPLVRSADFIDLIRRLNPDVGERCAV